MNDVARLAGVSHQTVSRVLNAHPNVRPETKARVQAAIEELGYRRNSAARALVTQRSTVLGIITAGSEHLGPARTLAAVEQSMRASGYFVSVITVPQADPDSMAAAFDALVDQSVEGVVVIAHSTEVATAAKLASARLPVVLISAAYPDANGPPTVSVDQEHGARIVAQHLLDLGHTDMVHIAGPAHWFDARARARGWHELLSEIGQLSETGPLSEIGQLRPLRPRPDLQGDWTADSGYAVGRHLLDDLPTAVFAANDQMALGVLRAFAEAGITVPGDVSVVGFDDIMGADNFYPPLTTVRQDFVSLGTRTVAELLAVISGASGGAELVQPELVVRDSTGPARD